MADFKKILKAAIQKKSDATPTFRKLVYKEAKENLYKILTASDCNAEEIEAKAHQLEKDIIEIEGEFSTRQKASIISLKNTINKKINLTELKLSAYASPYATHCNEAPHRRPHNPQHNPQREKFFSIFTRAQTRSELQSAAKLKRIITYSALAALLFILLSLYSGWRFFAHRNRIEHKKTLINTDLSAATSVKKFEGRLTTENKVTIAPSPIAPSPMAPSAMAAPINNSYDSANYLDKSSNIIQPARLSWDLIERKIERKDDSIIIARINGDDNNMQLRFSLKHNKDRLYKGEYLIEIIYTDANSPAEHTKLQLFGADKDTEIKLENLHYYHDQPHKYVYSFDSKPENLARIGLVHSFSITFTSTDKTDRDERIVRFSKTKNAKELFENFLKNQN